jgi:membrane protease subunit HflC
MTARFFGGLGLVIIAVIGFIIYLSLFVVQQTEQALVLRFGEPVRVVLSPGLYPKLPLIDNVEVFDNRILDLDSPPLEIIASDQKRLIVDAFGRYKIVDPLRFFQSVGTIAVADQRLSVLLNSAVRQVLGEASFESVVRDERADLMLRINERVNREGQSLGIEIVDVRIRRADLPEANSQAIYQRMQTERQREATEIRAQGEQAARRIRAEADRAATVIVAEANRESEQIRGDGDAARTAIFAEAYGANPEFFDFFRSMQAYQAGLKPDTTRMLISPDSEFFRYFNDATGAAPLTAERTPAGATTPTPSGSDQSETMPDSSELEAIPGSSDVPATGTEDEADTTATGGETGVPAPIVQPETATPGTMSGDGLAVPTPEAGGAEVAPAPAQ